MAELTYASYLHLDELLKLQQARSSPAEHDELLFIVIHQSTELWLKELLHELDKVKTDFSAGLGVGRNGDVDPRAPHLPCVDPADSTCSRR